MATNMKFQDVEFVKDIVHPYSKKNCDDPVIVVDNGSHSCRAGWSHDSKPRLVFRNLVAKLRGKKESNASNVFFGNDIDELEDLKWNIRTQFDMDTVSHFDTQELAFDYLFHHLGINTNAAVEHSMCITESVCIPNTSRQHMSEILFECYNVPSVIYGVDSLFSWYNSMSSRETRNGLIVRCGYQTSHVLPLINGKFDAVNSRRLNVGGLNLMINLRRLLQLKFPSQAAAINLSRAQELLIGHSYVATDYLEELKKWQHYGFMQQNGLNIQLPVVNTATERDLEMRKIQAKRLKEINQKKREEKIKSDEERLAKFKEIKKLSSTNQNSFRALLKEEGLMKEADLDTVITEMTEKLAERREQSRKYLLGETNYDRNTDGLSVEEIKKMLDDLEDEKLYLLDKRRSRYARKQALNKRKSYASKERMRILSQLAKNSNSNNSKLQKEDTFGMKDEDWDVYKYINKDGSESEDEQEQERLNEIEQSISQYQLNLNKLMVGRGQLYEYLPFNVEQIRIPEVLYQPSMVGVEQEGIAGMLEYVLRSYTSEVRKEIIKNVFYCGGPTLLPGFRERLEAELMTLLPFQSKFNVFQSQEGQLDAWHGARKFVQNCSDLSSVSITRDEYEEGGLGIMKEHCCSNVFVDIKE